MHNKISSYVRNIRNNLELKELEKEKMEKEDEMAYRYFITHLRIVHLEIAVRNDEWNYTFAKKWNYLSASVYLTNKKDNIMNDKELAQKFSETIIYDATIFLNTFTIQQPQFARMLFDTDIYYDATCGKYDFPSENLYKLFRTQYLYFNRTYDVQDGLDKKYIVEVFLYAMPLENQLYPVFRKGSIRIKYRQDGNEKERFQYFKWTEIPEYQKFL